MVFSVFRTLRRPSVLPSAVAAAAWAFALLAVAACATATAAPEEVVERPVEDLYNEAMDYLVTLNFAAATTAFGEIERQHPYSVWATRAQLMAAYAHYQRGSYDEAILATERYLQLHPGSEDAPYAHYLAAISYYDQIIDVGRDQAITEAALGNLIQVVSRYPDSEYARDAILKIDLTIERLAGKEMAIGRFYLRRGEYVAAINRFRYVIKNYETTTHTPEALHRLTEAYLALGVIHEAQVAAAVLGHNFPGSEWYADSYRLLAQAGVATIDIQGSPASVEPSLWQRVTGFFGAG